MRQSYPAAKHLTIFIRNRPHFRPSKHRVRANERPKKTDKQTDVHGDSMTELAQWGRFSENIEWSPVCKIKFSYNVPPHYCTLMYFLTSLG